MNLYLKFRNFKIKKLAQLMGLAFWVIFPATESNRFNTR